MPPLEIIYKFDWFGEDPDYVEELKTPVPYVVLKYNSRTKRCKSFRHCRERLRDYQKYMMEIKEKIDVDYNFYIGGDGGAYEGRGWDVRPVLEDDYYGQALTICYMGKYTDKSPSEKMVRTMWKLIEYGIEHDCIKKDYTLIDR